MRRVHIEAEQMQIIPNDVQQHVNMRWERGCFG